MIKLLNILNEIKIEPSRNPSINNIKVEGNRLVVTINQKHTNRSPHVFIGKTNGIDSYGPRKGDYVYYPWDAYFKSPDEIVLELDIEPRGRRYEFDSQEYDEYLDEVQYTKTLLKPYNPKIEEEEGYYRDFTKFILPASMFSNYKEVYEQWKQRKPDY